jgi:RNA polymerase sigma-B factor
MLRHLMTLHEQSSQCRRQREVIIERCLPLADHIARWFSNRGEPLEDFVQVARMGLIQAVNRLTPTTVHFLAFAVPTMMGEVRRILPRSRMVGEGSPQNERARFPAQ